MDQKCAIMSNPKGQLLRKIAPTIRDYFISKHKCRRPKKNGGVASSQASRANMALSDSSVSKESFITDNNSRITA
eukprot:3512404-Ditylum_brightwellii.AAC.1